MIEAAGGRGATAFQHSPSDGVQFLGRARRAEVVSAQGGRGPGGTAAGGAAHATGPPNTTSSGAADPAARGAALATASTGIGPATPRGRAEQ